MELGPYALREWWALLVDAPFRRRELAKLGVVLNQDRGAGTGTKVMDEEWDNLFILDACRYDVFAEHSDLPGELRKVRSLGSQSLEFMEQNFAGTHHDTVYVSANPFTARLDPDTFHAVWNLFDEEWDEELLTVGPAAVVEATLEAHERYPRKRVISHFMQPHYPFIGERGRRLESGGVTGATIDGANEKRADGLDSIWTRLDAGTAAADPEDVWAAYVENFRLVEDHVETLLGELDGKSVVTADHGNLFGEWLWPVPVKKYGHPPGLRSPSLVEVPWLELPFEERRTVERDRPERTDTSEESVVEDRLTALGYA